MRFTWPCSSSRSMKTIPFAVEGRWRATVIPANATCRPCGCSWSSALESVPGGRCGRRSAGVRPHRHPGVPVVREHQLPACQVAQARSLRRRLELERELLRLAGGPGNRLWANGEAELPEQVTAWAAEAVAGAALDERLEPVAGEPRAARGSPTSRNGPPTSRSATSAASSSATTRRTRCRSDGQCGDSHLR